MSVLQPRTRTVNFRISDEEFERLKQACLAAGARSVADFVRSVVLGYEQRADLAPPPRPRGEGKDVTKMRQAMEKLNHEVEELTGLVRRAVNAGQQW